ncbi:undecaprenyl/decaprenyl-phosphate alpha-N-acetylglucosaminyl 1-phosphate transferase [Seonamhaeicola sp. MEBiC1930]|uniref:MraY family glycosyltransferase n=1 Tax=Seonamhaeicola sp. MEBiC01930 TaxID=2976768 RepID=UPI003244682E
MKEEILSNITIVSILIVVGSFLLVYYLIPKIIFMVNHHNLTEAPIERSSHVESTPSMGGLSFFVVLILAIFFIKHFDDDNIGLNFVAALTVIFIIGLKDDLAVSTPRARLLVEILAITIMFFHSGYHVTSFDGFLGFNEAPTLLMDIVHIIIILTIINAYNLIDGVDGLASTIGITIFTMFGLVFFTLGLNFYFLISLSIIGILFAYMRYNFSHRKKIFMGDTGSLIIGFCIAILSLKFLTMEASLFTHLTFKLENKLFIIAGIIAVPLFDMMRVIGVRLIQGKSPFEADRNHIHHVLINLGFAHYKIAMILGLLNYILAVLIIFLASHTNSFQMMVIFLTIFSLFLAVFFSLSKRVAKKQTTILNDSK